MHPVRVVKVPPTVNEPGGHVRQLAAPASLHAMSAPHSVQLAAIAADHVPARHGVHERAPPEALVPATHAVGALVPSHACPGAQRSQRSRVVLSPPEVKEPPGQGTHALAPTALHRSSLPHAAHVAAPCSSLKRPLGHSAQSSSVSWLSRCAAFDGLWRPVWHTAHVGWFGNELYVPVPHTAQMAHAGSWQSLS